MKVSCIIPVYNAGEYLNAAIDSVLAQTYRNFEIILIDDGSKDQSWQTICHYQALHSDKIQAIQNRVNLGLPATLNVGIAASTGELIARMDADDICEPNRFAEQVRAFEAQPEIAIIGSFWRYMNSGVIPQVPTAHDEIKLYTLFNNPIGHPTVMFRKDQVLAEVGWYDENAHSIEDYEFWCRCLDKLKAKNLPEVLLQYRIHSMQISNASANKQKVESFKIRSRQIQKVLGRSSASDRLISFIDSERISKINLIRFLGLIAETILKNQYKQVFNTRLLSKLLLKKYYFFLRKTSP